MSRRKLLSPKERNDSISQSELDYLQKYEMSRRDFLMDTLAMGGLAATFGMSASSPAWSSIQKSLR